MATAVLADSLRKTYPGSAGPALDGFDLDVPAGTVHGLLGPNGAGKSTAVRILTTLLRADGGRAEIDGIDLARDPHGVRTRIGLVGQYAALDEVLDARRNLVMFGRLFHLSRADAARRADELLERFALVDAAAQPVSRFSGGMRRRLDLAVGMILAPAVLFLDEPTTGLDPRGRAEVWDAVRALVAGGTTVLLTTQYLDEADQLADRISVLGGRGEGRVVASGTPDELRERLGADRLELVVRHAADLERAAELVERVTGAPVGADAYRRRISSPVTDRMAALGATLTDTGVLAGRYLSHLRRQPEQVVTAVGFPILMMLIFVFLFGGMMAVPGGGDYRSALLPGLFTMTMLFGVSSTMVAVVTDAQRGITDRFRSMPMSPAAVLLGRAAADVLVSTLALGVLLLAGLAVGWRVVNGFWPAVGAVGLLLLLRFSLLWVGIYLGLVVRGPGAVTAVQTLEFPVAFLSGLFVAPASMPVVVSAVAEWNPLSATAAATRELFGNPGWGGDSWVALHPVPAAVLWPLLILAVFVPLSVRRYREMGR